MSILNVSVSVDRVLIGCDTIGVYPDGKRITTSKVLLMPHAGLAFAMRGTFDVFHLFFGLTINGGAFSNFDEARENAARVYLDARSRLAPTISELLVAGWSADDQRMQAFMMMKDETQPLMRSSLASGMYLAPGGGLGADTAAPTSDAEMMALARLQLEWMQAVEPEASTGGNLLVTELTRHSAIVRDLGAI